MYSTSYFLLNDQERDVIVHAETGVKVNVFGLEVDQFQPTRGELHIFGDDHGEWLAFETEGWNGEHFEVIQQAVLWYARYLDYPQMSIQTEDPRPEFRLRKHPDR
ncbi:hypothetical protein GCM10023149_29280 [Mucilaginibacter gynuensis]|uniref:Uncharacterized protein n=1 Tax=Mucilaginibacter gynuensis TaxID=1302236 RepID=A0ABP8GLI2_9SPHI